MVSGATIITDKMLYAASEAVAASLTEEERAEGRVFPRVARIRQVSLKVATEVAKVIILASPSILLCLGRCHKSFLSLFFLFLFVFIIFFIFIFLFFLKFLFFLPFI